MPQKGVLINAAVVFRSEIAQAHALGFRLRIAGNPRPHSATVQLVPETLRAQIICRRQGDHVIAIEATVTVNHEEDRLDCTRDAIAKALELAKDSGA